MTRVRLALLNGETHTAEMPPQDDEDETEDWRAFLRKCDPCDWIETDFGVLLQVGHIVQARACS